MANQIPVAWVVLLAAVFATIVDRILRILTWGTSSVGAVSGVGGAAIVPGSYTAALEREEGMLH